MKSALGLDEGDPTCFLYTYSIVMVLRKVRVLRRETLLPGPPLEETVCHLLPPALSPEGSLKSLGSDVQIQIDTVDLSIRNSLPVACHGGVGHKSRYKRKES